MQDKWTEEMVITRFQEAARMIKKLPAVKPKGYFNLWPEIIYRPNEMIFMDEKPKKWLPNPESLSRMYQTCQWLSFLNNIEDRKLIIMRAKLIPWKVICKSFSINRSSANKRYKKALLVIIENLNLSEATIDNAKF